MPARADLSRPLWSSFLSFLGPMMLANILQALSGTINAIYLGQMLGTDAMGSASVMFPLMFFFVSFVVGLGAGASVLIGQAWGAGNILAARTVAGTTVIAATLAGLAVAVGLTPFTRAIMITLHVPPPLMDGAVAYGEVLLGGMPVAFLFLLVTQLLRGIGDTMTPLLALVVSIAISMLLTPALIRGWGGLPQLGVASAGWATLAGWSGTLVAMLVYLRLRRSPMAPDLAFLRLLWPDRRILARVLRLGVPTAVQMVMMALAEMVLLGLVNRFGADATAAYGAVNQVLAFVQFPAMSISIAVTILSAQAIGARRTDRLGQILRLGLGINLVLTGALVLLAYAFSGWLVGLFVTRPAVIGLTETLLHIVLWSAVVYGAALAIAGQMRASGTVMIPTALQIGCIALIEVPVAWWLSDRIGVNGVWIGYPAVFVAMLVAQTLFYRLVWRHRPVVALV